MKRDLAMAFSRVTEGAALAGYKWLGRGDKNAADNAAVEVMRTLLNQTEIDGEIVIGEGEIDEAPMLYIGEKVGTGGDAVDIAVDPIEGTRMTAMGQNNALAVLAATEKGAFLKAPDMYMEKLVVGPAAKGVIDLDAPLADNLEKIATALNKSLHELVVITLAKPRHDEVIAQMQAMGVRVFAVPDGDVAASILTCSRLGEDEIRRCHEMGIEPNTLLRMEDMAKSDNVIFAGTGITKGDLLEGIHRQGDIATTETLLIRGKCRTIRRIKSTHYLERKDDAIKQHIL